MYIAFGNRVIDSNDIKKIIEENTEFKVIKDMSKGSKREDIVAFNLSLSIDVLNEEIKDDMDISEADEDTLFEEYMAFTEELGFELEELQKNNDSLNKRLKEMEDAAASKGDVNNKIKEQLDKTKII